VNHVVARALVEAVVTVLTVEKVVAAHTVEGVVARAPFEHVVAGRFPDGVVAARADEPGDRLARREGHPERATISTATIRTIVVIRLIACTFLLWSRTLRLPCDKHYGAARRRSGVR
jgi:hypothetical protein